MGWGTKENRKRERRTESTYQQETIKKKRYGWGSADRKTERNSQRTMEDRQTDEAKKKEPEKCK